METVLQAAGNDEGHEREESSHTTTFESQPTSTEQTCRASPAQIIAMVSNFSTSYNVVNVSLALPVMKALYHATEEDTAGAASSLLAGMMLGQLAGGALGDSRLGRLGALRVVMALQVVGSLGSSFIWSSSSGDIYLFLALWRFILGVGAGGVYPLAAVLSAEQGHSANEANMTIEEQREQLQSVVLTFSMQGVGFLAVPVVALPLLFFVPDTSLDLVWRFILGMGALPGIILMILQCKLYGRSGISSSRSTGLLRREPQHLPLSQSDTDEIFEDSPELGNQVSDSRLTEQRDATLDDSISAGEPVEDSRGTDVQPEGIWQAIRKEPSLAQKFLGTAMTWCLFDILFYGNTLFQPLVLDAAFGGSSSSMDDELKEAATNSLILSCIALPGYVVSAFVIGRRLCYIQQSARFVQLQGFVVMALLYAIIGAYWSWLRHCPALLVILYGGTFFFANYGPNTTTFCLPSLVYSPECRSTLNGISAAMGKAGALFGATLFAPAADMLGDDSVMLICAGISVVAYSLTFAFVRIPSAGEQRLGT